MNDPEIQELVSRRMGTDVGKNFWLGMAFEGEIPPELGNNIDPRVVGKEEWFGSEEELGGPPNTKYGYELRISMNYTGKCKEEWDRFKNTYIEYGCGPGTKDYRCVPRTLYMIRSEISKDPESWKDWSIEWSK